MTLDPCGPVRQSLYCTDIADLATASIVARGNLCTVGGAAQSLYYAVPVGSVSGTSPSVVSGTGVDWVRVCSDGEFAWSSLTGYPTITATFPIRIDAGDSADLSTGRTLSVSNATTSSVGVVALIGDISGSATDVSVVGLNGASIPSSPTSSDIGSVFCVGDDELYVLEKPWDIGWMPWTSKITILSSDTTKPLLLFDLTDANRASTDWAITIEFETLLSTTDTGHIGRAVGQQTYEVVYNGSGVPAVGLLAGNIFTNLDVDHFGSPGIPTITSVVLVASGTDAVVTLTKPTSANDTYAVSRIRILTAKEIT